MGMCIPLRYKLALIHLTKPNFYKTPMKKRSVCWINKKKATYFQCLRLRSVDNDQHSRKIHPDNYICTQSRCRTTHPYKYKRLVHIWHTRSIGRTTSVQGLIPEYLALAQLLSLIQKQLVLVLLQFRLVAVPECKHIHFQRSHNCIDMNIHQYHCNKQHFHGKYLNLLHIRRYQHIHRNHRVWIHFGIRTKCVTI